MSLYSCKRRACYHHAAEPQVCLPVPLPPAWLSPHGTFCDKCRGRAAWLSCPPAAAPPGRSRTRRRPWSARHLGGEDRAAVRQGPPEPCPPWDGVEPRVTAAGAAVNGVEWQQCWETLAGGSCGGTGGTWVWGIWSEHNPYPWLPKIINQWGVSITPTLVSGEGWEMPELELAAQCSRPAGRGGRQ